MAHEGNVHVIKAERIVRTALGLLERELMLPSLVWRDAAGDFRGVRGDTITIRLPAYWKSNKRALRSGATREKSELFERSVDVTLDTDLYGVIPITDEELTLDIESFNEQVLVPVLNGLARGVEDELLTEIRGADYEFEVDINPSDPYKAATRARRKLNDGRVPMPGRAMIVGSEVEEVFLNSDRLVKANESGSTSTLREAIIGRIAGMPVISIPALAPDEAYAFHRTAYVLNSRAPFVPRGVAWGASLSYKGYAMRVAQQVDPDQLVDNFHADVWTGTNHVKDVGHLSEDGQFEPAVDPDESGASEMFVRAVKLTLGDS